MDQHQGRAGRRRLLTGLGSIPLAALLTGCGQQGGGPPVVPASTGPAPPVGPTSSLARLFQGATTCALTPSTTQGPYYLDAGRIRRDIREDRPGTRLRLAIRLQDSETCTPLPGEVVEIWHCDAAGRYSGAPPPPTATGAVRPNPTGAVRPGPTGVIRPSSVPSTAGTGAPGPTTGRSGGAPATRSPDLKPVDDQRYLRGAQVTDDDGIVEFVTIWPGWYPGRAVHIHVMVRVNDTRVLTTQLMFDDRLTDRVYAAAPYNTRLRRDTTNAIDPYFHDSMLVKITQEGDGWLGVVVLTADSDTDGA